MTYDNSRPEHKTVNQYSKLEPHLSLQKAAPGTGMHDNSAADPSQIYDNGAMGTANHVPFAVSALYQEYERPGEDSKQTFASTMQIIGELGQGEFGR